MQFLRKLFDTSKKDIDGLMPLVHAVNDLEDTIAPLSDEDLRAKGAEFKQRIAAGESLEALMPEVFAAVREASKRLLHMRQFDV